VTRLGPGAVYPAGRGSQLPKVRATSIGFIFQTFNLIPPCRRRRTRKPPWSPSGSSRPSAASEPGRPWRRSGSASGPATCLPSSPAGSSSASPWPGTGQAPRRPARRRADRQPRRRNPGRDHGAARMALERPRPDNGHRHP
jgi:hypothetical protein